MKRVIAYVLTIIVLGMIFTGCGKKTNDTSPAVSVATVENTQTQTEKTSETSIQNTSAFPLTIKDDVGFEMTIAEKPVEIVSLALGSDEILLDLVDKSRIKALTTFADDPGTSNIVEKAKGIGDRVISNSEKIISLKPDLVITSSWADPDFVKQLRNAGITVYIFNTPSNYDQQKEMVNKLAKVTGEEENGLKIIKWMDDKLSEIEAKLSSLKPEDKLTVMDYGEFGSSGKGTNFDDIVTRAGLVNVVSKAGLEGWSKVSKEKIVEYDPDILVLPSLIYDKNQTVEGFADTIRKDKGLAGVKAVKNNRLVFLSNPHVSAMSQYVVLGIEDAARAAYPELFK